MATGTTQPKATKDTFLIPPDELVLDRDWDGRWHPVTDEPVTPTDEKNNDFNRETPTSIRELAASIKENGQLEEILVCKRPADANGLIYHVVTGRSRLRAFQLLAKEEPQVDHRVRCRVLPNVDDRTAFLLNEEENRKRNNLTLLDKAYCMKRERDLGMTADEIATRWGCTVPAVTQALSLIDAPIEVQQAVADKVITGSDVISTMKDLTPEEQIEIVTQARTAKEKNIAFKSSDVKKLARQFIGSRAPAPPSTETPAGEGQQAPTNGSGAVVVAPEPTKPRKRGRPSKGEKKVPRGLADLRRVLQGRDGVISQGIIRFLDGFPDMNEEALENLLNAHEYEEKIESGEVQDDDETDDEFEDETGEGEDEVGEDEEVEVEEAKS